MDSIVIGAGGFIGSALVAHLLDAGHAVGATVRAGGRQRLLDRLAQRGADTARLTVVDCDIAVPGLQLPAAVDVASVRDVYNCAARYEFGLAPEVARAVNVDGALHVVDWAATLPALRRLVHLSGFRAALDSGESDYATGAYEASKVEAHGRIRDRAGELGVALTTALPGVVAGPGQYIGLAELVAELWAGKLVALPGGPKTLLPLVDLDYLVRFLALLPTLPETAGRQYLVLDQDTPALPELVARVADHLRVAKPRFSVPVSILARLPQRLTGADAERLSFMTEDRYDTAESDALAQRAGLVMPPIDDTLRRWADHLVASRVGAVAADPTAGFVDGTWVAGARRDADVVLLHGLPLDGESWQPVRDRLGVPAVSIDLPGTGRSAPTPRAAAEWLDAHAPTRRRPVLVGHSLGADIAVQYAVAHPDRVGALVLVSPSFLQARAGWPTRSPLAAIALRHMSAAQLARRLGVPDGPAIQSAAANLHRSGVAFRTGATLRETSALAHREHLRTLLAQVQVPVHIVVGADDPLVYEVSAPVTVAAGGGHYPQLTHPDVVAAVVAAAVGARV